MALQFFVRERDTIKIYSVDEAATKSGAPLDPQMALPFPEAATWSPNGRFLGLVDPNRGVMIIVLSDEAGDISVRPLQGSSAQTRQLHWSSQSSFLISLHPLQDAEPNLIVWDSATGTPVTRFTFTRWREKSLWPAIKWSMDELLAIRMDGTNAVIMDGKSLETLYNMPCQTLPCFEIAPVKTDDGYRVAIFSPELRSSDVEMKVLAPGKHEVFLWSPATQFTSVEKRDMPNAEEAEIMWSPSGKAYIVHTHQQVDETGQSYFGASTVYVMAAKGGYSFQLGSEQESEDGMMPMSAADRTIQAVVWSPTRDEFILVQGFQPAVASLWGFDEHSGCRKLWAFPDRLHRNTVRWNRFGSLVCLGGFGNLAGDMDFWYRDKDWEPTSDSPAFLKCGSAKAPCTVACEWAPNGRHFITAVLSPRMRVDNAVTIWRGLCGEAVNNQRFQELFEAIWKPTITVAPELSDEEIALAKTSATKAAPAPKRAAYRPPGQRGEGGDSVVAARMALNENMDSHIAHGRRVMNPRAPGGKTKGARGKDEAANGLSHPLSNGKGHPEGENGVPTQEEDPGRTWDRNSWSRGSEEKGKGQDGEFTDGKNARYQKGKEGVDQKGKKGGKDGLSPGSDDERQKGKGRNSTSPEPQMRTTPPRESAKDRRSPEPKGGKGDMNRADQALNRALDSLQVAQDGGRPAPPAAPAPAPQPAPQPAPPHAAPAPQPVATPPETGWEYIDTTGNVQGPFSIKEMRQWNQYGYFMPELMMRASKMDAFQPLKEMYPDPMQAFAVAPRKPRVGRPDL